MTVIKLVCAQRVCTRINSDWVTKPNLKDKGKTITWPSVLFLLIYVDERSHSNLTNIARVVIDGSKHSESAKANVIVNITYILIRVQCVIFPSIVALMTALYSPL